MSQISIGHGASIPLRYVNRHGIITGPTGTGKTVSIMRLTDELSAAGVPVLLADVKGDLWPILGQLPGAVRLDPFGTAGVPIRTTVQSMGPELLARCLELTDVQAGTLQVVFAVADKAELPLQTITDLKNVLKDCAASPVTISRRFAHITAASIGVIQRKLIGFDMPCFDNPRFDVANLLVPGQVSILDAVKLMQSPRVYASLLMHLLTELYDRLPESGDLDKPRLAFIFDEAHLLFSDVPPALLAKIERTVRLIRSKGVGVYFASQSIADVPEIIRSQCSTAIRHSRDLGVGKVNFQSMDDKGRTTARLNVKVYLPTRVALEAAAPIPVATPISEHVQTNDTKWTLGARVEQAIAALIILLIIGFAVYGLACFFSVSGAVLCSIALGGTLALFAT